MTAAQAVLRRSRVAGAGAVFGALFLIIVVSRAVANPIGRNLFVVAVIPVGAVLVVTWLRPRAMLRVALVLLAVIPIYAVPTFHGLPLYPAVLVCWPLALILTLRVNPPRRRATAVDAAVAATVLATAAALLFEPRSRHAFVLMLYLWIGPYLCGRMVVVATGMRHVVMAFIAAGLCLAPFTFAEALSGHNVFVGHGTRGAAYDVWLQSHSRIGFDRVSASFGHPIALGMFLATTAALALALAVTSERPRARTAWLAAAMILIVALALTLSRAAWLVLFVGTAPLLMRVPVRRLRKVAVAGAVAVVVIAVLPQAGAIRETVTSLSGRSASAELAATTGYRFHLLREIGHHENFRLLGTTHHYDGLSIDNEYVYFASQWGFAPALALAVAAVCIAVVLIRSWRSPDPIVSVTVANLLALLTVALITQQQIYIWLLMGAASVASRRPNQLAS